MTTLRARSVSLPVLPLFDAPARTGVGLGHGYVDFGDRVIALTAVGAPRMPNGIECDVAVLHGAAVTLGSGRLTTDDTIVLPGDGWDPVPRPRVMLAVRCARPWDPLALAGQGPGLTPAGDDLIAGYVAGLVLFCGRDDEARAIAEAAASRTTALSATLLRHAARGELPEAAHSLLEDADPRPLMRFGRTSGRSLLFGLALAGGAVLPDAVDVLAGRGTGERAP